MRIGDSVNDEGIQKGLNWFIDNQGENGLWKCWLWKKSKPQSGLLGDVFDLQDLEIFYKLTISSSLIENHFFFAR